MGVLPADSRPNDRGLLSLYTVESTKFKSDYLTWFPIHSPYHSLELHTLPFIGSCTLYSLWGRGVFILAQYHLCCWAQSLACSRHIKYLCSLSKWTSLILFEPITKADCFTVITLNSLSRNVDISFGFKWPYVANVSYHPTVSILGGNVLKWKTTFPRLICI